MIRAIVCIACSVLSMISAMDLQARADLAFVAHVSDRGSAATVWKQSDGPRRSQRITVAELAAALRGPNPPLVIDVREPSEFDGALGHIHGARLIPRGELPAQLNHLEGYLRAPIVTVCLSGVRSSEAAAYLSSMGFEDVRSLDGGMRAWNAAGMPVDRAATARHAESP